MKNDNVHDFFHNVSRLTIILPIIIIGLAIILKPRPNISPQTKNVIYTITPSATPVITGVNSKTRVPINLQGPYKCTVEMTTDEHGMVYIKNKHIRADLITLPHTVSAILNGDCLYKWEEESTKGIKICGLSQYVGILDTMANFGALDAQTLMTMVTQFGNANGANNIPKEAPETTCKKDQFDESIFDIPKAVQFELRTATPSAK